MKKVDVKGVRLVIVVANIIFVISSIWFEGKSSTNGCFGLTKDCLNGPRLYLHARSMVDPVNKFGPQLIDPMVDSTSIKVQQLVKC